MTGGIIQEILIRIETKTSWGKNILKDMILEVMAEHLDAKEKQHEN